MQTMQVRTKVDTDGHLRLDIPFEPRDMEVNVLLVIESDQPKQERYDFSHLMGKLKWKGDAVRVQRELRNEW
ncbi:MAG: hypothetical protein EOL88_11105 [Bacteroidia bacterium]|nr:hypothetical protein [Bacteroidia bacterium]